MYVFVWRTLVYGLTILTKRLNPNVMMSGKFQILLQRSKTATHLLQLHTLILKTALDYDPLPISQFILSISSVSIELARLVFDRLPIRPTVFAWNTIIRAYAKSSVPLEAVKLFSQMQRVGLQPDNFTYPFVVKACGRSFVVGVGEVLHSMIVKGGIDSDRYVGNTLLRMYADLNVVRHARRVFDEMTVRDVVSWSSMIAGYVACNCPADALILFGHMILAGEKPNSVTLVSLLAACTRLLNISVGESVHSYIIVNYIRMDVALGTAILEMYSKCGHIEKALQVFNSMTEKNLQSWTVMISGLADHGLGEHAISLFTQMEQTGVQPDSTSFSGILSACSHMGLVDEGQNFFNRMVRFYNIKPRLQHYGCMVDMFARAGMIEEAYEIIKNMPMEPSSVILRSFIGGCRSHGRVLDFDENLRRLLLEIEPDVGANFVLVSGVSSLSGCWNEAAGFRVSMKEKGLKKVPGWSRVEVSSSYTEENVQEVVS